MLLIEPSLLMSCTGNKQLFPNMYVCVCLCMTTLTEVFSVLFSQL